MYYIDYNNYLDLQKNSIGFNHCIKYTFKDSTDKLSILPRFKKLGTFLLILNIVQG